MSNTVQLSEFFQNEYTDFATYDLVRKIASYVDGQKNASRKILHTVREQNINTFTKVSNLGPKIQDFTEYLHGALDGTIVNVTADYVGSGNNIPLLEGDGNFGSAMVPSPAASRYIFARQNSIMNLIFRKEDTVLLPEQYFEGSKIEPKYYVPALPMIAINGSEGISLGFAQKILPRDPVQVMKWVEQKAQGKRLTAKLTPFWKGMSCTVEQGVAKNQWLIKGSIERKSRNRLMITSIPVGYSLKQYQSILDKLTDDKVIRNYDDLSDNDEFLFEVSCDKDFSSHDDEWILSKLKLVKTISENYTCIDRDNKIVQFNSIQEILEAWYEVRIEYNQKRKDYIIDKLSNEINEMTLKAKFIKGVIDGAIELRYKTEEQIIAAMVKVDPALESYTKFMNLPLRSLTKEQVQKLMDQIKENKELRSEWETRTPEFVSTEDIKRIEDAL